MSSNNVVPTISLRRPLATVFVVIIVLLLVYASVAAPSSAPPSKATAAIALQASREQTPKSETARQSHTQPAAVAVTLDVNAASFFPPALPSSAFPHRRLIREIDVFDAEGDAPTRASPSLSSSLLREHSAQRHHLRFPAGRTLPYLPRSEFQVRRLCEPYTVRDAPRKSSLYSSAAAASTTRARAHAIPMNTRCRATSSDLVAVRFSPSSPSFSTEDLPPQTVDAVVNLQKRIADFEKQYDLEQHRQSENENKIESGDRRSQQQLLRVARKEEKTDDETRKQTKKRDALDQFRNAALNSMPVEDSLAVLQYQQVDECAKREKRVSDDLFNHFSGSNSSSKSPKSLRWNTCLATAIQKQSHNHHNAESFSHTASVPENKSTSSQQLVIAVVSPKCPANRVAASLSSFFASRMSRRRELQPQQRHHYHFQIIADADEVPQLQSVAKRVEEQHFSHLRNGSSDVNTTSGKFTVKFIPRTQNIANAVLSARDVAESLLLVSSSSSPSSFSETLLLLDLCDTVFGTGDPFLGKKMRHIVNSASSSTGKNFVFAPMAESGTLALEDFDIRTKLQLLFTSSHHAASSASSLGKWSPHNFAPQEQSNDAAQQQQQQSGSVFSSISDLDLDLLSLKKNPVSKSDVRMAPDGFPLKLLRHEIVGATSLQSLAALLRLWSDVLQCRASSLAPARNDDFYNSAAFHVAIYFGLRRLTRSKSESSSNNNNKTPLAFEFLALDPTVSSLLVLNHHQPYNLQEHFLMKLSGSRDDYEGDNDDATIGSDFLPRLLDDSVSNKKLYQRRRSSLLNCVGAPYSVIHGLLGAAHEDEFWRLNFAFPWL